MIELAVGDLILEGGEIPPEAERFAGIYVVADGETVLYVGRSTDCAKRIVGHCGWHWSSLGQLIEDNEEDSFDWKVRFYAPEEFGSPDLPAAERAAIARLRPCVNAYLNEQKPPPLPERYRAKERQRQKDLAQKIARRKT